MPQNHDNRVKKLNRHPRFKSSYLPRVEKTAANRAINRLCRGAANDNPLHLWQRIKNDGVVMGMGVVFALLSLSQIL